MTDSDTDSDTENDDNCLPQPSTSMFDPTANTKGCILLQVSLPHNLHVIMQ